MTASTEMAKTAATSPRRPSLAARSMSDFTPSLGGLRALSTAVGSDAHGEQPTAGNDSASQVRGDEGSAFSPLGNTKIVSGGLLATGGRAPASPFLPLAPAPSLDELQHLAGLSIAPAGPSRSGSGSGTRLRHGSSPLSARPDDAAAAAADDSIQPRESTTGMSRRPITSPQGAKAFNGAPDAPIASAEVAREHACSTTPAIVAPMACLAVRRVRPSAASMVRSFSLPVPTQAEFEAQRKGRVWSSTAHIDPRPFRRAAALSGLQMTAERFDSTLAELDINTQQLGKPDVGMNSAASDSSLPSLSPTRSRGKSHASDGSDPDGGSDARTPRAGSPVGGDSSLFKMSIASSQGVKWQGEESDPIGWKAFDGIIAAGH